MNVKEMLETMTGAECRLVVRFHGYEMRALLNQDLAPDCFSAEDSAGFSLRSVENAATEDEACRAFLTAVGVAPPRTQEEE